MFSLMNNMNERKREREREREWEDLREVERKDGRSRMFGKLHENLV